MTLKASLKTVVAAAALLTGVNADAAILTLTWSDQSGVFDVFQIDNTTAVDNSVGGYLYIPVFNSSNGYNGMFVGAPGIGGHTGLGFQNGSFPNVNPWFIEDYFGAALWSGSGYTLNFTPGQTYFGTRGTQISVAGAIPEPNSWAMLIAGFGLVGAVMRRRETRTA